MQGTVLIRTVWERHRPALVCLCLVWGMSLSIYYVVMSDMASVTVIYSSFCWHKNNSTGTDHQLQSPSGHLEASPHSLRACLVWSGGTCSVGEPLLRRPAIKAELPRFLKVYNNRPGDQVFGTSIMHQFALWCILRHLQPKHVIESGVYQGLGTWIIRQALPDAQLILLDNRKDKRLYTDGHSDTLYFTGAAFRDFGGIHLWKDINLDFSRTLLFLDDHQTPLIRIPQAVRANISHVIVDDNYWIRGSDTFSMKQACACILGMMADCTKFKYRSNFGMTSRKLTQTDIYKAKDIFKNVQTYWEFPMLWNIQPRLANASFPPDSSNLLYNSSDPRELLQANGLGHLPSSNHLQGHGVYFNIAYLRLSPPTQI